MYIYRYTHHITKDNQEQISPFWPRKLLRTPQSYQIGDDSVVNSPCRGRNHRVGAISSTVKELSIENGISIGMPKISWHFIPYLT